MTVCSAPDGLSAVSDISQTQWLDDVSPVSITAMTQHVGSLTLTMTQTLLYPDNPVKRTRYY